MVAAMMNLSRASRRASTPAFLGFLLCLTACGGGGFDEDGLRAQGAAGDAAADLILAHGGMDNFLSLEDLQLKVSVEVLNPSGALASMQSEIHRFQAGPPRRYLLRRTGTSVLEFGLGPEGAWARVDGQLRQGEVAAGLAHRELWLRSVLNRAPFSLADPDVDLAMSADGTSIVASWSQSHLAGGVLTFVVDEDSGKLDRILFGDPGQSDNLPVQLAVAESLRGIENVLLVDSWAMSPIRSPGFQPGIAMTRWIVEHTDTGTGFTSEMYQAERP